MATTHPATPLARTIILGTKGSDVLAVKRALSRAGYMEWGGNSFTDVAGPYFREAVHHFQHDEMLPPAGYGYKTHEALLRRRKKDSATAWAWDSYSIQLMHEMYVAFHVSPETRIRSAIIQAARNIYAHRYEMAYSQSRPFPLYKMGGQVPGALDCSAFATDCYYAAGARNPNVFNGLRAPYDGEGYTGTLLDGGMRTSYDRLKPGDLIFYGFTTWSSPAFPYGSPTHVAVYDGTGHVFSNGHSPMGYYPVYYGMSINCYVTYNVVP